MIRRACQACGEGVTWARRNSERFHPPLERAGEALVIDDDDIVRRVSTYRLHACDARKVADHLAAQRRTRANDGVFRDLRWKQALPHDCPKCPALAGERCINLNVWHKGSTKEEVVWPHEDRWRLTELPSSS